MAKPIPEDTTQAAKAAFSFLMRAAPSSLFQSWHLAAGRSSVSLAPGSEDAYNWLLRNIRSSSGVSVLVKGRQFTRFVAIETDKASLRAFPARAMAAIQAGSHVALLWRLANETDIAKGDLLAAIAIERIGGRNLRYLFPLPGSMNEDGRTFVLKRFDPECVSRPTQFKAQQKEVQKVSSDPAQQRGAELIDVLKAYGIEATLASVVKGPTVTTFEVTLKRGTPGKVISERVDDIAREMSAPSAYVMPSTGRNTIGIQLPNQTRETVSFSGLLDTEAYRNGGTLPLVIGKDAAGEPLVVDLQKMPHLLIAGTTGSGKSVGVKTMVLSLAHRYGPDDLGFVQIDVAKRGAEFSVFNGLPHLISSVVTTPERAVQALQWVIHEMETRYEEMTRAGTVNIGDYNARVGAGRRMAYIVVVIDEFANLMLTAPDEIQDCVQRIAQEARAVGIHLIMATQTPRVTVVTGVIKANLPTRISYRVVSWQDSMTILDKKGAESLLDEGDGIWLRPGGHMARFQGSFIGTDDIRAAVARLARGPARNRDIVFAPESLPERQRQLALAAPDGEVVVETAEERVIRALRLNGAMSTVRLSEVAAVNRQKLHRMKDVGLIVDQPSPNGRETRWTLAQSRRA